MTASPMPASDHAASTERQPLDQDALLELARKNVPEELQAAIDLAVASLAPTQAVEYTVVTSAVGTTDAWPA